MPTYEYRCKACGHEFEELQSMSENPLTVCPKCAEPALRRVMGSGIGTIFKGSGFYQTDYRKSSGSPAAKSPDASPPATPSPEPSPPKTPDKKSE